MGMNSIFSYGGYIDNRQTGTGVEKNVKEQGYERGQTTK